MKVIVTGGAGFIGSSVIRRGLETLSDIEIVNVDCLTYAGNLESIASVEDDPRYRFEKANICNREAMDAIFREHLPDGIIHLAAESHVDRSIDGPSAFIETNISGTYTLLEATRSYLAESTRAAKDRFIFHHVSTDEVYGSLGEDGLFAEDHPYDPRSPYSASKAASDHLVRAWHHTYELPTLITNCSNNYGPFQYPEKLVPLMILNALEGKDLPIYGDGKNVRDWLYVDDHADALWTVFRKGKPGDTYNIGGHNEKTNLETVGMLAKLIDELGPDRGAEKTESLITLVRDRPGHDMRYAIDASHIERELGWKPRETFESGLRKTVQWYIENRDGWCRRVLERSGHGAEPMSLER